jgi:Protein of unknown function (DUF1688)
MMAAPSMTTDAPSPMSLMPPALQSLFTTATTRQRARALLAHARSGASQYFVVHDSALGAAADLVAKVTRQRYPDLNIPYHSRWRHFETGGIGRRAWLNDIQPGTASDPRALIDLVIVSVLLDAGAGPDWRFKEASKGASAPQLFSRSEGLGVASFHAFTSGLFSSDPTQPLRCDATALQRLSTLQLANAFQVSDSNPLVGLEGRAHLLRRLGKALMEQPEVFKTQRPGDMFDYALQDHTSVTAHQLLAVLLQTFTRIWPSGSTLADTAVGDCWPHSTLGAPGTPEGWIPFHKLSQWLTYSLLEPFEWAGIQVTGLEDLTGLPEYRNGGLLLDAGVLQFKDTNLATQAYRADHELIVEWRALTVALLDELAPLVRERLGRTEAQMPLACVLEGGTWAAGRVLAQQLRGGKPPLNIESDGTIF